MEKYKFKWGYVPVKFACIPKVITTQGEEHEELTRERRRQWISAVSRGDTDSKNILDSERVCSLHFVTGKAASVWDKYNIDWVPTQNLGKKVFKDDEKKEREQSEAIARAERAKDRRKRTIEQQEIEAAKKRKELDQSGCRAQDIPFSEVEPSTSSSMEWSDPMEELAKVDKATQTDKPLETGKAESETQTEEFAYMFHNPCYQAPTKEYFDSAEKVRFYTGLPSLEVLMVVHDHVAPHVTRRSNSLDSFQELVMILMKLRLNVPFQDLAYRFLVSLSTMSRIFNTWIVYLVNRLSCFIMWPSRDQLWKTMPMCFQYTFGRKVTVIIDCFEVFIERPTNLLARAQTFSSYKHHNTVKVLIGITPQGTISFVSEAWGGRTSDKFLTENCGFLDYLLPGDTVMADRGFTITESVGLKHGKLMIPAFTKGKSQLEPVDVERSRGIASVRIHVERVIGLLRRKYTILQSTLPTDFLYCNPNGPPESQVPVVDRIIRVCSALINFCPPIVPFD